MNILDYLLIKNVVGIDLSFLGLGELCIPAYMLRKEEVSNA